MFTIAVLVMGLVLVVSACGGGSSSTSGGSSSEEEAAESGSSGGGSAAEQAKPFEEELAALYKGTSEAPSQPPVKPEPGKNVWVISTGQSIETAQNAAKAMEEVGEKLDWKVTVFDGKFESARELTGVQQAIAAGADGIVLLYVDCAPIKAGLQQAKAAGIDVVGVESEDCEPALETAPSLFAKGHTYLQAAKEWGEAQVAWVVSETKGEAKTIYIEESDLRTTRSNGVGVKAAMERCSTCELTHTISFVGTEFGPPLQQKVEQALNQYPEANSVIAAYDAVLTSGGAAAALRASGRLPELKVMGGEGSVPGIELIYNEAGMDACVGLPTAWSGYDAMMVLSQLFAGRNPVEGNSGIGWQVCDKEHNLPPKGEVFQPSVDYVADYEKIWGLK
ncbi:MAG: sugar ABC transporter substrate-binding protein [Actinobacteria bacterium]|nr:sugar ABC transporter substrate-binding protein [Actinomycetota bacterium]